MGWEEQPPGLHATCLLPRQSGPVQSGREKTCVFLRLPWSNNRHFSMRCLPGCVKAAACGGSDGDVADLIRCGGVRSKLKLGIVRVGSDDVLVHYCLELACLGEDVSISLGRGRQLRVGQHRDIRQAGASDTCVWWEKLSSAEPGLPRLSAAGAAEQSLNSEGGLLWKAIITRM